MQQVEQTRELGVATFYGEGLTDRRWQQETSREDGSFPVAAANALATWLGRHIFLTIQERCGKMVIGHFFFHYILLLLFLLSVGLPDRLPTIDPCVWEFLWDRETSHFGPEQAPCPWDHPVEIIAAASQSDPATGAMGMGQLMCQPGLGANTTHT